MNEEEYNPWSTLSVREVYDNPWIKVTHEEVLNPSDQRGIYGKVHFKHLAIAIVPLDNDWNTRLIGQYRYTLDEYSWEVPEGGGPIDSSPLNSAKRELLEETGLIADEWIHLLDLTMSNSVTDERGIIFLARELTQQSPDPDETEELRVKILPFQEALQWIESGHIDDSLSINALWAADRYLNKEKGEHE